LFYFLTKKVKKFTHYQRLILSVCLSSVVTFANIYWLQPLLPVIQKSYQINTIESHFSMSAPLLGMGLGLLIFASLSDVLGRGVVLLVGMALGICTSLLLPLVDNYPLFLAMRFFQGAFFSVCPAVAVPLLAEELRKSWLPAAVGFYIASNTLGGLISRLVGGIGTEYLGSWQAAGYTIALTSSVLFFTIYYCLPKQRHFNAAELQFKACVYAYWSHLKRVKLVLLYVIIGIGFGCFVNLTNYLMTVLDGAPYRMPSDLRSLMFLTLLGGTTSSSLAGKFSNKHSQIAGVGIGLVIMLFSLYLLNRNDLSIVIIGMIFLAIGFFFCHANASTLVGKSVKKGKGSAQALYSLFYYSGASLGVVYFEPYFSVSGWKGVLDCSAIALCLAMVLVVIYQVVTYKDKNSIPHAAA